jgi:anti-sigma regulatory factor (Ser/Thr protein kinase)
MGELCGMHASEIKDVKLAVDEACSNVIKYAYRGRTDQTIAIAFNITKKGFEVIIEDDGVKAHPECMKGRDLDDVRPGGLGIHLIKRAFDVFAFDEKKETGNRLMLVRHFKKAEKRL